MPPHLGGPVPGAVRVRCGVCRPGARSVEYRPCGDADSRKPPDFCLCAGLSARRRSDGGGDGRGRFHKARRCQCPRAEIVWQRKVLAGVQAFDQFIAHRRQRRSVRVFADGVRGGKRIGRRPQKAISGQQDGEQQAGPAPPAKKEQNKQRRQQQRQRLGQREGTLACQSGERPRRRREHSLHPPLRERRPEAAGERKQQGESGQRPRDDVEHISPSLYIHYFIAEGEKQMQFLGARIVHGQGGGSAVHQPLPPVFLQQFQRKNRAKNASTNLWKQ